MKFQCKKCKKYFSSKQRLIYHLNKKKPCEVAMSGNHYTNNDYDTIDPTLLHSSQKFNKKTVVSHKCLFCGREFNRKSNLNRHVKKYCKKTKKVNNNDTTKEIFEKMFEKINELEAKNSQLEKSIQFANSINNGTINIDNSQHQVNNVNITVNPFGEENLDYLSKDDQLDILGKMHKSIIRYAQVVYFNPDHPENHNVHIPSLKNSWCKYLTETGWTAIGIPEMVEKIVDKGRLDIEEMKNRYEKKLSSYKKGRLEELFNAIDGDDSEGSRNIMKVAEEKIKFIGYDNRRMVKKTIKEAGMLE